MTLPHSPASVLDWHLTRRRAKSKHSCTHCSLSTFLVNTFLVNICGQHLWLTFLVNINSQHLWSTFIVNITHFQHSWSKLIPWVITEMHSASFCGNLAQFCDQYRLGDYLLQNCGNKKCCICFKRDEPIRSARTSLLMNLSVIWICKTTLSTLAPSPAIPLAEQVYLMRNIAVYGNLVSS